jgi:sugar phosphate isomerase/epimerase
MEKTMKTTITGFFDAEGHSTFEDQMLFAQRHGIDTICLRTYNGQPLIEVSDNDLKKIANDLKLNKMKIGILDSNIQSFQISDTRKQTDALDEFKYMIKLADRLKISHVLFRLPKFDDVINQYEDIEKVLTPFFEFAYKNGKKIILIPVHGYRASTYAYLIKKMKTNHVSVLFDPVTIMSNGESTTTSYRSLRTSVGAFMCIDADHDLKPKLIGHGKTNVLDIIKKLNRDRFDGFLIMDNKVYQTHFPETPAKEGFFKKLFGQTEKKKESARSALSKIIFPNEETKNVTYDDIIDNQIKLIQNLMK